VSEIEEKSAVIFPFLEVEDVVDAWRRLLDPSQVRGIPAHVTVLFPFVHPIDLSIEISARLEDYFSKVPTFKVIFETTQWFEDRVVYLQPEPGQQFRTMTMQLLQAFPSCLPYGGQYADPIPHLTIGDGASLENLQAAERAVREHLPIETMAKGAWLMTGGMGPSSWSLRKSFPLGE
jgi:hypothetical protein